MRRPGVNHRGAGNRRTIGKRKGNGKDIRVRKSCGIEANLFGTTRVNAAPRGYGFGGAAQPFFGVSSGIGVMDAVGAEEVEAARAEAFRAWLHSDARWFLPPQIKQSLLSIRR